MIIPVNSPAEEIVRRREINKDIDAQIEQLKTSIAKNEEIITALTDVAEWAEVPDPIVNPEPEPLPETPEVTPADIPALDQPTK